MTLDCTTWLDDHGNYLLRYALRHFPQHDVAEELVQETFVSAIEAAARYEGHASPRTWLTAILRHKIIDRIRRSKREELPHLEATESLDEYFDRHGHWLDAATPEKWTNNPEQVAIQWQFQTALRECVAKLPPTHQQVFLLREVSELESEEVCHVLEISPANLRVILHRSRLSLQSCLSKNWSARSAA